MTSYKTRKHYSGSATRHGGKAYIAVTTAQDEEQAYSALKLVKKRAARERAERRREHNRQGITLPTLRFLSSGDEE